MLYFQGFSPYNLVNQNRFTIISRSKNQVAQQMLSMNQIKQILDDLAITNYVSGPEPDRDRKNGEVWIFGYIFKDSEFYIKLKIVIEKESVIILSFHEAEFPLIYPYK